MRLGMKLYRLARSTMETRARASISLLKDRPKICIVQRVMYCKRCAISGYRVQCQRAASFEALKDIVCIILEYCCGA